MNSKFEEYLKSQRREMDIEDPDDQLIWNGISNSLATPKLTWRRHFWKAAAILIFLASSTYIFVNEFYRDRPQNIYNITLSEIEPEYADKVAAYSTDFEQKLRQVNNLNSSDLEQFDFFFNELNNLDTMYRGYQEDFHNYGYNERLVKAMLDYYEKRVRILDRMLMEIQKHKDYEERKEVQTEI
jgi:hypothetical protein